MSGATGQVKFAITYMLDYGIPERMADGSPLEWDNYEDMTDNIIAVLVQMGHIVDLGCDWFTEEAGLEPAMIYMRRLRFTGWIGPEDADATPDA